MATKTIKIHINDEVVEVELKSARKADGIWRAELMAKATLLGTNSSSMVAFYLYPTCLAAVKAPAELREMNLEDFINNIDEADIDLWVSEAYELNPQWKQAMKNLAELGDEDSKKTGTPSSGLMPLTEEKETQGISLALKN